MTSIQHLQNSEEGRKLLNLIKLEREAELRRQYIAANNTLTSARKEFEAYEKRGDEAIKAGASIHPVARLAKRTARHHLKRKQ